MTATELVEKLNLVRSGVKAGETSPEVERQLAALAAQIKQAYTPEGLKAALAGGEIVPSPLEEALTTLFMTWTSVRGRH